MVRASFLISWVSSACIWFSFVKHRAWEWLFYEHSRHLHLYFSVFLSLLPSGFGMLGLGGPHGFCKQNIWHNRTERFVERSTGIFLSYFVFGLPFLRSSFCAGFLLHLIMDVAEPGRPYCYDCYDTMYMTEASVTLCYHLDVIVIVYLVLIWILDSRAAIAGGHLSVLPAFLLQAPSY